MVQLVPHHQLPKGLSINYVVSRGEGIKNCQFYQVKIQLDKSGEGGQKLPILSRHSLWTAPNLYREGKQHVFIDNPSFILMRENQMLYTVGF